jgi:hypothetical protein
LFLDFRLQKGQYDLVQQQLQFARIDETEWRTLTDALLKDELVTNDCMILFRYIHI